MKALDLFCGAGGAAKGLQRAGFHVTGIDIKKQPRYCGDAFIQADATAPPVDLAAFDFIWASPPCQAHSTMKVMPNARKHADLIPATREVLARFHGPWVIENVIGAPLEIGAAPLFTEASGVILCGSMFNLQNGTHELRRHRMFEANFTIRQPNCRHSLPVIGFYGDHARTRQRTVAGNRDRGGDIVGREIKLRLVKELMGIDWMEWSESNQAIPPAYSEFIAKHITEAVQ